MSLQMKRIHDLTQKMRAVLEDRAGAETAATLAEQYEQLCRQAEERLSVVRAMLEKHNDYQALQAAEQEPALLDFIGALSFGGEMDWQHYCEHNGLPVAPILDSRAVQRVMALYENPITAKHPLYRDFRTAILERDDEKALRTVRTILKLNPGDETARRELKRLENKRLQVAVDHIKQLLETDAHEDLQEHLEFLESSTTPEKLARVECYEPAKQALLEAKRRSAESDLPDRLDKMEALRAAGDWKGVGAALDAWNLICQEAGGVLGDGGQRQKLQDLTRYFKEQKAAMQANKNFENAFKSFMLFVEEMETRLLTSQGFSADDIREKDEIFVRRWKELESYNKPVPGDQLQRIKSVGAGLRSRQDAMQKAHRLKFAGLVGLATMVLLSLAGISWHAWKAHRLSSELAEYQQKTQCVPAEQLITTIRSSDPSLLKWPYLQSRVEEVGAWTKQARASETQAQKDLEALNLAIEAKPPVEKADSFLGQLKQTESSVKQVCLDLGPPLQLRLDELKLKADLHMSSLLELRVQQTLNEVDVIEAEMDKAMSFERTSATVSADLKQIDKRLQPLDQIAQEKQAQLQLPEDLKLRIAGARTRFGEFDKELQALQAAKKELQNADTYEGYLKALRSWQGLRFVEAAPAIKRVDTLPTEKALMAQILTSGDERILKAVEEDTSGSALLPNEPTESDLNALIELRDDSNLGDVYEHLVVDYSKGSKGHVIWSQGTLSQSGGILTGKCYDPDAMYAKSVFFTKMEIYASQAQLLSPRSGLELVGTNSRLSSTSQMMASLKLRRMTDDDGKIFRLPVLDLLDQVVRYPDASPLAKAYLMQELYDFAKPRAFDGGLHLCSSLKSDIAALKGILEGSYLSSEDWMAKEAREALEPKLKSFFVRIQPRNYFKEAQARRQFLLPVIRAGMKFGGHVDLDKKVHLTLSARNSPEIWCLREGNLPLLLSRQPADGNLTDGAGALTASKAQVLSPVFYIPVDRKALIEAYQTNLSPAQKTEGKVVRESYFLSPDEP